jgi:hypothetical protein
MFGKLLLVILTAGATGVALLVLRQHRIDAAHEMSIIHQRVIAHERALWRLRTEVAERCRPAEIRRLIVDREESWHAVPSPDAAPFDPLVPIPADAAVHTARVDPPVGG